MSHPVAGTSSLQSDPPRRRRQRACDICRHKKIRCDGSQVLGRRCSPCKAQNLPCTYTDDVKKLWPDNQSVVELQQKLERMESLLAQLSPGTVVQQELDQTVENNQQTNPNTSFSTSRFSTPSDQRTNTNFPTSTFSTPPELDETEFSDEYEDADGAVGTIGEKITSILDPMQNLSFSTPRFYGQSSGVLSVHKVINSRNDSAQSSPSPEGDPFNLRLNYKREKFWSVDPWELPVGEENECNYTFPDHDLLISLVDLYFEHVNVFTPVLHRPTFERSFAEGLHLKDRQFGAVVLLVYSAGYKWFQEVQIVDRHSLSAALTLYELQMYCLAVFFSHWTTTPLACWTIVGIGIRRAQDVGVHRRKVHRGKVDTVENELWKRGFWVLVVMDRYMSSALGRPCAMQDDEFDLDYPVECDDEFWLQDDPAQCFKQPPGRLSVITFFVLYIKLQQIIAMALRTVYSINIQVKVLRRLVGPDWQEKIVAELDSSLNEWTDLIPEQLRWDPSREINLFFNQSAMLYASYYHAQILIHRPFISPAKRNSSLALPSIVICTNAARSGSQVVGLHRQRSSELLPYIHMPIFTNGIVLLLYIWGNKRFGFPVGDVSRDWAAVRLCMDALRAEETRWQVAGRLWDILHELTRIIEQTEPASPDLSRPSEVTASHVRNSASSFTAPLSAANNDVVGEGVREGQVLQEQKRVPFQDYQQRRPSDRLSTMPASFSPSQPHRQSPLQPMSGGGEGTKLHNQMDRNFASGASDMALTENQPFYNHMPSGQSYAPQACSTAQDIQTTIDMDWSAMQGVEGLDPAFTDDTIEMWGSAPSSFELADWDMYLSNGMVVTDNPPLGPTWGAIPQ